MRYLWVEDFNDEGNGDTDTELKERLTDFFDLQNDKVINKMTLSSAIEFLEMKENFDEIDAVLIDIRFPEGTNGNLYNEYFSDIVTPEFYAQNIEDASGIMLYLLLIFRYHMSQQKIAFISANISNDNRKMELIQSMIEIIVKSKFTVLSEEDIKEYKTSERNLGKNVLGISSADKEWNTFISNNEIVENNNLDELIKQIRLLPLRHRDKFLNKQNESNTSLYGGYVNDSIAKVKYNAVKDQFEKVGFVMPSAFEKPRIGEKKNKRYAFLQWELELQNNAYNMVRSNVQEMCIVLIDYLQKCKTKEPIYTSFLEVLTCGSEEKQYYDKSFFIRYLKNIKGYFSVDLSEHVETYCERITKEITALWEASAIPKTRTEYEILNNNKKNRESNINKYFVHDDKRFYALHATLKIVRNWIGHQGINDVEIVDVGLLFLLNMRGIFEIEKLPEHYLHTYLDLENTLLSLYEFDSNVTVEIEESLEYFVTLNKATKNGKNESKMIHDRISGLGHSQSKIRREVSMDEIYMLLYHLLDDCDDIYSEIKHKIQTRTWKDWRKRYNQRFEKYVKLAGSNRVTCGYDGSSST